MNISFKKLSALALVVLSFGVIDLASAHHSFAMFDRDREEVMSGEVVRWAFNSPHTAVYIRTDNDEVWAFEGAAPASLVTRSPAMNGFTFQPGDEIEVVMCPLRDGRTGGAIGFIIKGDEWYAPNDGGCGPNLEAWHDWKAKGYMSKQEAMDAGEEMPE
jgi:hypothetical protein